MNVPAEPELNVTPENNVSPVITLTNVPVAPFHPSPNESYMLKSRNVPTQQEPSSTVAVES